MRNEKGLKNLFNFLKGLGYFSEYDTFEEFEEKKIGIKEELEEEDFEAWKEKLDPKDRERFDYIFGDN